jgi:hypothetical protein
MKLGTIVILASLAPGCVVTAHEVHDPALEARIASSEFELLKSLKGDWTGTADGKSGARVTYEVGPGGETVIERVFPEDDQELVTVYRVENGKLMLTKKRAFASPRPMLAEVGPASVEVPIRVTFECPAEANTESELHVHRMHLFLEEEDHLFLDWTYHKGGTELFEARFDFRRALNTASRDVPAVETHVLFANF